MGRQLTEEENEFVDAQLEKNRILAIQSAKRSAEQSTRLKKLKNFIEHARKKLQDPLLIIEKPPAKTPAQRKATRSLAPAGHRQYLVALVGRKARGLECPVCLEEAAAPIYGCPQQFHILCGACRAQGLAACPTCRSAPAPAPGLSPTPAPDSGPALGPAPAINWSNAD